MLSPTKKNRFLKPRVALIMLSMLVMMAVAVFVGLMLVPFSHDVAKWAAEVAHMRLPVLIMAESVVALFLLACALSVILLVYILRELTYTKKALRLLNGMSICFFLMLVPLWALIIYTNYNVENSITNIYCTLGIALAFVAGNIFGLFAQLVKQAAAFKTENDLTV